MDRVMAELLLEILSEEIPARMQNRATEDLKRLVTDGLKDAGLDFHHAQAYATPRRLSVIVDGLPKSTPDISEERKGPRTDSPKKAINGFLSSLGLTLDVLEKRETGKGEFYFAVIEKQGQETGDILKTLLENAIAQMPWPKSMRWAGYAERWIRPIHSLVCLFEGKIIPLAYGSHIANHFFRVKPMNSQLVF